MTHLPNDGARLLGELEVAVVGAGIVGASIAFRLAREGVRVWLVDTAHPASGTSSASFAWVNANAKTPREYFELNRAGMAEYHRLRGELPGGAPWLHAGGNLVWIGEEGRGELERRVERLRSWGYAAEWIESLRVNELMEPRAAFPEPETRAASFPGEFWVDAPGLVENLVEAAHEGGAETRFGAAVTSIETREGRVSGVRLADGRHLRVDVVVNAAGPGADWVAALVGRKLPLVPRRGLLARISVDGEPLRRILHTPPVNLRPDGPGRLLLHHESVDAKLDDLPRELLGRELLERARQVLSALEGAEVEEVRVGVRPIPQDGFPCVGAVAAVPGYYEAVTHSGVTLGPLLGRLLAGEILTGIVDPSLVPYRTERFA